MGLNFLTALAAVTLVANPTKEVKEVTTRTRVEKNPTNGADFRILSNGKVYPSQAFVDEFNLEYTPKNSNTISNGIDIFDSSKWGALKDAPQMLLGYSILQTAPKVELFAGSRYDEQGAPINSVMEQGTTLSDETLELIATAIGYSATYATHQEFGTETKENEVVTSAWANMLGDRKFVDFYMIRSELAGNALVMPDGIYNIPKLVERGEKKGTYETKRRENITVLPIVEYTDEVAQELKAAKEDQAGVGNEAVAEAQLDSEDIDVEDGVEVPFTSISQDQEVQA